MDPDFNTPVVVPIEGARPDTPHPVRSVWRGVGELALFFGEAVLAVLDLFVRPKPDRPPRQKSHPVEKVAPFPIND